MVRSGSFAPDSHGLGLLSGSHCLGRLYKILDYDRLGNLQSFVQNISQKGPPIAARSLQGRWRKGKRRLQQSAVCGDVERAL